MSEQTCLRFIESYYEDIVAAMDDADKADSNVQYRLGVRRLAWAFFNKFELFEIDGIIPSLAMIDVDEWFSGGSDNPRNI